MKSLGGKLKTDHTTNKTKAPDISLNLFSSSSVVSSLEVTGQSRNLAGKNGGEVANRRSCGTDGLRSFPSHGTQALSDHTTHHKHHHSGWKQQHSDSVLVLLPESLATQQCGPTILRKNQDQPIHSYPTPHPTHNTINQASKNHGRRQEQQGGEGGKPLCQHHLLLYGPSRRGLCSLSQLGWVQPGLGCRRPGCAGGG